MKSLKKRYLTKDGIFDEHYNPFLGQWIIRDHNGCEQIQVSEEMYKELQKNLVVWDVSRIGKIQISPDLIQQYKADPYREHRVTDIKESVNTNITYRVEDLSGEQLGIVNTKQEAIDLFFERYKYLPKKYLIPRLAEPYIQEIEKEKERKRKNDLIQRVKDNVAFVKNDRQASDVLKLQKSTAKIGFDSAEINSEKLTKQEDLDMRYERFQKNWRKIADPDKNKDQLIRLTEDDHDNGLEHLLLELSEEEINNA